MTKLDKIIYDGQNLVPNEVQGNFVLSSDSPSSLCTSLGVKQFNFSEDTYNSINKLSSVLRKIDLRMQKEGYTIIDGKLAKYEN